MRGDDRRIRSAHGPGLPPGRPRATKRRSRAARVLVGALALGAWASVTPASAAITPVGVKTTSLYEAGPSAGMDTGSGDSYFAWYQNSERAPRHFNAYLDTNGGSTIRLNARNSFGFAGGIDSTTVVFQEVLEDTGNSDLVLYDIASATRLPDPSGLNGRAWQWGPTISGTWILYGENSRRQDFSRVMLHDTSTGEERILTESSYRAFNVWQGQVSGDYAVYYKTSRAWNVFVYTISTGQTTKVPNPNHKDNYRPAITADGTVYYVHAGNSCGENVRIYRWSVANPTDPSVLLMALPDGAEIAERLYAFNDGVSTSVYFDRFRCSGGGSNIYRLDDADTATAITPRFVGRGGAHRDRAIALPGARAGA